MPAHGGSSTTARLCAVYPCSTSDAQWALLEPLLPPPGNTGGKGGRDEKHSRRRVVDAIFYVVSGGIAWRALPREFPPAMTVYDIFRRWVKTGAWQRIHDALRDQAWVRAGRKATPTAAVIDSQSVRAGDTVPAASGGWDNVVGIPDADVTAYQAELRSIIERVGQGYVELFNLDSAGNAVESVDHNQSRHALLPRYGEPLSALKAEIRAGGDSLSIYRVITRFLVEDANGPDYAGTTSAVDTRL